jgi:hypothetical protein
MAKKQQLSVAEQLYVHLKAWAKCVRAFRGIAVDLCRAINHLIVTTVGLFACFAICKFIVDGNFSMWVASLPAAMAGNILYNFFRNHSKGS